MQSLALAWLGYRLSGSPLILGLMEFFARGPILVLGLVGGLFADRWSRYRLMLVTQSALLLQASALAALTLSGSITVGWILGLALVLGVVSALEIPVRQAFVADLVPRSDLPSAIGLNSSLFNAARIVGPSLAGLIVSTSGEGLCFLINALSFLIILGCLLGIRIEPKPRTEQGDALELLREGLRYAWHTPHVRAVLAVTAVLSVAATPYSTLLPVLVVNILHSGPGTLGWLMAASGLGALAAAFRHAGRRGVKGLTHAIAVSVGLLGAGMLVLALSSSLWVSTFAMIAIGFGLISTLAGINILLQSLVPDALRGRVVSFFTTLSLGWTIFGSLWAGLGATYLGAPAVIVVGALVLFLTAGVFWVSLPTLHLQVSEHQLIRSEEMSA